MLINTALQKRTAIQTQFWYFVHLNVPVSEYVRAKFI